MPHEADNVQKWAEKVEHTIDPVNWRLCTLGKPKAIPWADDFDFVHFNGQKKKYEITGVLAEGRGELATHPCNNCALRYYPFEDCKIVPGHLEEACANCYYNKQICVFKTPSRAASTRTTEARRQSKAQADKDTQAQPKAQAHAQPNTHAKAISKMQRHLPSSSPPDSQTASTESRRKSAAQLSKDLREMSQHNTESLEELKKSLIRIELLLGYQADDIEDLDSMKGNLSEIYSNLKDLQTSIAKVNVEVGSLVQQATVRCESLLKNT